MASIFDKGHALANFKKPQIPRVKPNAPPPPGKKVITEKGGKQGPQR